MGGSCFVPNCQEGNRKIRTINRFNGTENKSMFKAPKDPLLLKEWKRAIGRSDKELNPDIHYVCERHFEERCLSKYFESKMPDGTVHRIKRIRASLMRNAVPSIFPDSPQYSTVEKQFEKSSQCERQCHDRVTEQYTIVYGDMSFFELKRKVRSLPLPNDRWFFACVDQSLVLFKINSNQDIEKEIVISEDLTLNVFLDGIPFYIKTPTNICGIKVVLNVLKTVDRLKLCAGTGIDICLKADRCFGYAENNKNMCAECAKKKKSLLTEPVTEQIKMFSEILKTINE